MADKTNKTVVRNAAYRGGEFNVRERHNERKNESYGNGDIDPERANLNIHFRRVLSPDGTPETYEQTFNRLLEEGTIVKRGLRKDAKVFDEMVFDVNSAYFEEHGGYDYAKKFFEETYRLAVKEIGGEDYILSAVLHADERNKALSEQLGRDVYHYHLHVVYVPVVSKEIFYSKDHKDPEKAGKLREVITQISHAKKWPGRMPVERNGKTILLNSYSLLQDRFYEHMRAAGFEDFERGKFGSTAVHMSDAEYKLKKEQKRLASVTQKIEKKEARLKQLDERITDKSKAAATIDEIEVMGKPVLIGSGFSVSADEMKTLKTLAKKSVTADEKVKDANRKRRDAERERDEVKAQIAAAKKNQPTINEHITWFGKFMAALKRAPKRLMAVIEDILRQPPEQPEPVRARQQSRTEAR